MTKQAFEQSIDDMLTECTTRQGRRQAERFTEIMQLARGYGIEDIVSERAEQICEQYGVPTMWELPAEFDKAEPLPPYPLDSMPELLRDYLKAACEFVQVKIEMGALPLLSVLALCVQGKAVVKYPGINHTEPLNLYTLTVASPGERKSAILKEFMRPVDEYQARYNKAHRAEIIAYRTQCELIKKQRDKAIAQGQEREAHNADSELSQLEVKKELCMNVTDATPESLALMLAENDERLGVIDSESGVFDVLAGIYTKGVTNIDVFLKSYTGEKCQINRISRDRITLDAPLLTMCLMTQPEHYMQTINNSQFKGRGFIQRFLFAFPESMVGKRNYISPNISDTLKRKYAELIECLLVLPYQKDMPVIECDAGAGYFFDEYFRYLQESELSGGALECMADWGEKHFARALRIAGILHICKHRDKFYNVRLDDSTAKSAIAIARWSEAQAVRALSGEGGEDSTTRAAKLILHKLKRMGEPIVSRSEITSRVRTLRGSELDAPLELLEAKRHIKIEMTKSEGRGRAGQMIKVNPNSL